MGLRELFKAGDLLGFIAEFRRIYGDRGGAVALWQDMAIAAGLYDE